MIQVLFDISMPKSCAECPFIVHCDECESWENYCPLLREHVGYDYNEPYTPKDHRQENCPLNQRPHGEWIPCSERLPEEETDVLVWYEYYSFRKEKHVQKYGIGYVFKGQFMGDVCGVDARCIAWTPLPDPYKERMDA